METDDDDEPLLFPSSLRRLYLFLLSSPPSEPRTSTPLLAAIGHLSQLHTLRLNLWDAAEVWLAPLQQLPLLRDLQLSVSFPDPAQFATELRALPWLHSLRIVASFVSTLALRDAFRDAFLCDAPDAELCALQWRELSLFNICFTDQAAQRLPLLPSLERLQANVAHCRRFDFLSALPQLTELELQLQWMKEEDWRTLLGVFTSDGLARLRTLSLHGGPCSSEDLTQLLSHTPALTNLALRHLAEVTSLSVFQQLPHLSATLLHLTLECTNSWSLTAADLPALLSLQQLRELRLLRWPSRMRDRLTLEDRAPFQQRPCSVLPHLAVFEWTMQ
jgi:hypothetical protein